MQDEVGGGNNDHDECNDFKTFEEDVHKRCLWVKLVGKKTEGDRGTGLTFNKFPTAGLGTPKGTIIVFRLGANPSLQRLHIIVYPLFGRIVAGQRLRGLDLSGQNSIRRTI